MGKHAMAFLSRLKTSLHLTKSKSHGSFKHSKPKAEEPGPLTKAKSAPEAVPDSVAV